MTKIKPKNYVNRNLLAKTVIVDMGRGKRSKELDRMLLLICDGVFYRLQSRTSDMDDRYDIYTTGVIQVITGWKNIAYDSNKAMFKYSSDSVFSYYSELAKRGYAAGFGIVSGKNSSCDDLNGLQFYSMDAAREKYLRKDHE